MSWLTHHIGWQAVYWFMGALGIALALVVPSLLYSPKDHPKLSAAELDYITAGGALVEECPAISDIKVRKGPNLSLITQLLSNRTIQGIMLGQFCINVLIWFFTTWFPIYLVQARHLSLANVGIIATIPAIAGFLGGVFGGLFSDYLISKQYSLSVARKTPIMIGMLLAISILGCIFANSTAMVVLFLSIAFFGKGFGALGWAVVTDTAPREIVGLCGSLCNIAGNAAGIVTPIVIGYIVQTTHSFNGALVFVALAAAGAIASYAFLVGTIQRIELKH